MPRQDFQATLFSLSADATAVANTAAETILVPDFVIPSYTFIQGSKIRATFMGRISNIVTAVPTMTIRARVGATTLSATAVFASGALAANTSSNVNLTFRGEYTLTCRTNGSTGTIMCAGQLWLPNLTAGNAVGNVGYPNFIPVTAPATQTMDTTIANILSLSGQWSAASASNSIQIQEYALESMN